jgi:hypothetical protein
MSMDFALRLALADNVTTRELDGELVLLNYDSETYFGLDEVGARILEVLQESPSVEAGLGTLLGEFDVEESELRTDVEALVDRLVAGGLVALEPA